jgi:hypothetical protein
MLNSDGLAVGGGSVSGGSVVSRAPVVGAGQVYRSEINQWPIHLELVQSDAPFFKNRELVLLSTCSPLMSPEVHWRFVRGRGIVVACPRQHNKDEYVQKLAAIFRFGHAPRVIVVRMEVSCCGGLAAMAAKAREIAGRNDLRIDEATVTLAGDIVGIQEVPRKERVSVNE